VILENKDIGILNIEIFGKTQVPTKLSPPSKPAKASVFMTYENNSKKLTIAMPKGHKFANEIFPFIPKEFLEGKNILPETITIVDQQTREQCGFFASESDIEVVPLDLLISVRLFSSSDSVGNFSVAPNIKLDQLEKLCSKYFLQEENPPEIFTCTQNSKLQLSPKEFDAFILKRTNEKIPIPNLEILSKNNLLVVEVDMADNAENVFFRNF